MTTNITATTANNIIPKINNINLGNTSVFPSSLTNHPIQDTYTPSNQNGLSSKSKWLIGLGVAATIGGTVLLAMRGKFNKAVQLAEHIDFKPARTIEEAREFAMKNLGIKKFDVSDIQMANYVNEGLTRASNFAKGKIVLPRNVESKVLNCGLQGMGVSSRTLYINPNGQNLSLIGNFDSEFLEMFNKADFNGKMVILTDLSNSVGVKGAGLKTDKFFSLYHELGHANHFYQNPKLYKEFGKGGTGLDVLNKANPAKGTNATVQKHMEEMLELGEKIGKKPNEILGDYAMMYPNEYVADLYAHLMSGRKFSQPIMDLYYKYGGPKIGV